MQFLEREGLPASFIVSDLMVALLLYLCCAMVWITAELLAVCMDYSLLPFILMHLEGEKCKVLCVRYFIFLMVIIMMSMWHLKTALEFSGVGEKLLVYLKLVLSDRGCICLSLWNTEAVKWAHFCKARNVLRYLTSISLYLLKVQNQHRIICSKLTM